MIKVLIQKLPPDFSAFAAIRTNIDFLSAFQDAVPELPVGITSPDLLKAFAFKVSEFVCRIFVEAAGDY